MTKRKEKWWAPPLSPPPPPHIINLKLPGLGISMDPRDRAIWMSDKELRDPVLDAIITADRQGRPNAVSDFLRSRKAISKFGRFLIADYIERLKHKRTPMYDRAPAERRLEWANFFVEELVEDGIVVEKGECPTLC